MIGYRGTPLAGGSVLGGDDSAHDHRAIDISHLARDAAGGLCLSESGEREKHALACNQGPRQFAWDIHSADLPQYLGDGDLAANSWAPDNAVRQSYEQSQSEGPRERGCTVELCAETAGQHGTDPNDGRTSGAALPRCPPSRPFPAMRVHHSCRLRTGERQ